MRLLPIAISSILLAGCFEQKLPAAPQPDPEPVYEETGETCLEAYNTEGAEYASIDLNKGEWMKHTMTKTGVFEVGNMGEIRESNLVVDAYRSCDEGLFDTDGSPQSDDGIHLTINADIGETVYFHVSTYNYPTTEPVKISYSEVGQPHTSCEDAYTGIDVNAVNHKQIAENFVNVGHWFAVDIEDVSVEFSVENMHDLGYEAFTMYIGEDCDNLEEAAGAPPVNNPLPIVSPTNTTVWIYVLSVNPRHTIHWHTL